MLVVEATALTGAVQPGSTVAQNGVAPAQPAVQAQNVQRQVPVANQQQQQVDPKIAKRAMIQKQIDDATAKHAQLIANLTRQLQQIK